MIIPAFLYDLHLIYRKRVSAWRTWGHFCLVNIPTVRDQLEADFTNANNKKQIRKA